MIIDCNEYYIGMNLGKPQGQKYSDQRFKPFAVEQIEQLGRGAARVLVADFPLSHGGQAGVEHRGQHGLAEFVAGAQSADFLAGIFRHRSQAQGVVFPHPALVDETGAVEVGAVSWAASRIRLLPLALLVMANLIQAMRYAAARCSGSTDSFMPTALSTARRVFRVGLPLGDSERYSASRLRPASAATALNPP